MLQYLFALLPVAATCGWFAGRKKSKHEAEGIFSFKMRRDYFKGLNYLINEQPDKAVDVFIKLLEVDSDTVETHLALGSLFRRRGEVERAIRIHQNIIARPNLGAANRLQALSELGQDYLSAGVLDRAERLFLELIEVRQKDQSSYRFLLHIYQQEKDWHKAIEISQKLQALGEPMAAVTAQYYCELAEKARSAGETNEALMHLKKAQFCDAMCVRANLIRAKIELACNSYKSAIQSYQKVVEQDPVYLQEVVKPLIGCYQHLNAEAKMINYFQKLLNASPHISLILAIYEYLSRIEGDEAAQKFITEQVQKKPSLSGIKYLVQSYLKKSAQTKDERLAVISELVDTLLRGSPVYRCNKCGFSSMSLYWLCPSCHHWSSIKPIQGYEVSSSKIAKTYEYA